MHNFEELKIWQKAMDLTTRVYEMTALLPDNEKYGLTTQIRKSAISIPSNIAEGSGRNTNGEFKNFLGIANGSAKELHTQIVLANRLNLISKETTSPILADLIEIEKMSYALIKKFSN